MLMVIFRNLVVEIMKYADNVWVNI